MKATAAEKYQGQYIELSNQIIQAKEKTSLLESKIEVLAVRQMAQNLKSRDKVDADGNPYTVDYVELRATEIRALTDRSGGSLYDDIFSASISLKNKFHIILDKASHKYIIRSLYGDIGYENGIMTIEYNPETEYLFKDLKANYTKLSLPILFSFKTNGGFQLYKLLKSFAFNLPSVDKSLSQEELPRYRISYPLSELRMTMGFVDLNQKDIKREAERRHPDFDRMADMELHPKYKRWSDLNSRVIRPGVEEINAISDIYISEVETDSAGKGSKVTEVSFYIQHNLEFYRKNEADSSNAHASLTVSEDGTEILTPEKEYSFEDVSRVMDAIDAVSLSTRDAQILLQEAKGDLALIKKAYTLSCRQEHITNFMGWMRAAIRDQYVESRPVARGSEKLAAAQKELQEESHQYATQERVWKKTQEKPDFADFLREIGYSLETLDLIYESPREKVELYADWKVGRL